MTPHVFDTLDRTPRPRPWLSDGPTRLEALRELLRQAERDERREGGAGAWARFWARLRAWRRA